MLINSKYQEILTQIENSTIGLSSNHAIEIYKKQLKQYHDDLKIKHFLFIRISECYYDLEQDKRSIQWAEKALTIDKNCHAGAMLVIQSLSVLTKDSPFSNEADELIKRCQSILKRKPKSPLQDICLKNISLPFLHQSINTCNYFLGELYFHRWCFNNQLHDKKNSSKYINKFLQNWSRISVLKKQDAKLIKQNLSIENYFFRDKYNCQIDNLIKKKDNYQKAIDLSKDLLRTQKSDKYMRHILYHSLSTLTFNSENYKDSFEYAKKAVKSQPDCFFSIWFLIVSSLELLELKKLKSIVQTQKYCDKIIKGGKKLLRQDACGNFREGTEAQSIINDCRYVMGMLLKIKWEKSKSETDRISSLKYLKEYLKNRNSNSEMKKTNAVKTVRNLENQING